MPSDARCERGQHVMRSMDSKSSGAEQRSSDAGRESSSSRSGDRYMKTDVGKVGARQCGGLRSSCAGAAQQLNGARREAARCSSFQQLVIVQLQGRQGGGPARGRVRNVACSGATENPWRAVRHCTAALTRAGANAPMLALWHMALHWDSVPWWCDTALMVLHTTLRPTLSLYRSILRRMRLVSTHVTKSSMLRVTRKAGSVTAQRHGQHASER